MRPLYDAAPSGSAMLDILDIIADSVSISAKSTPCRALVGAISVHQCSNARSIVIQEKARQKQNAPQQLRLFTRFLPQSCVGMFM
jgi:hypothetical protein